MGNTEITILIWLGLVAVLVIAAVIATKILGRDDMPIGRHSRTAQLQPSPSGYRYDRPETVQFSRVV